MPWVLVIVAGLLEVAWAIGLKYSEGFSKPVPSLFTVLGIVVSMLLLAVAARSLPIGTAYAVWVGIGAFGSVVMGIVLLGEPATPARMVFLGLMLISIIGLKCTH